MDWFSLVLGLAAIAAVVSACVVSAWAARVPSSNADFGLPDEPVVTNLVSLVTSSRNDAAFGRRESPRFVGPAGQQGPRAGGMEAAP